MTKARYYNMVQLNAVQYKMQLNPVQIKHYVLG